MKRYFIEEAKCGISNGGIACGPVPGAVVGMVKYNDGTGTKWLYLDEFDGLANFIMLDHDEFDTLAANDFDSDFGEYIEAHFIDELDGISLSPDYGETYESIYSDENKDNPAAKLIRFLITLVRCDMEDLDEMVDMAAGKYVDELDIPTCDEEEEFLGEDEED